MKNMKNEQVCGMNKWKTEKPVKRENQRKFESMIANNRRKKKDSGVNELKQERRNVLKETRKD